VRYLSSFTHNRLHSCTSTSSSLAFRFYKIPLRPRLRPVPRWGSLRRSPISPNLLGRGYPTHSPSPTTFSVSCFRHRVCVCPYFFLHERYTGGCDFARRQWTKKLDVFVCSLSVFSRILHLALISQRGNGYRNPQILNFLCQNLAIFAVFSVVQSTIFTDHCEMWQGNVHHGFIMPCQIYV